MATDDTTSNDPALLQGLIAMNYNVCMMRMTVLIWCCTSRVLCTGRVIGCMMSSRASANSSCAFRFSLLMSRD